MALSSVFVVSNSLRLRRFRTAYPAAARPEKPVEMAKNVPVQVSSGTAAAAPPDTQLAQLAAITARLESVVNALPRKEQAAHNGNPADGDGQQRDLQRP
jgi:hypothetical protein